jgi:hypothetical protein
MQFMTIGALAMKNRSLIAAVQQSFADTASALFANIQHTLQKNPCVIAE